MAAMRCAGAGRALLRRSPGLLCRRAADVGGERGVLLQHPIAPLSSLSSNRYMSSYHEKEEKTKLATELMKGRMPVREIKNLDEMLRLVHAHSDREQGRRPNYFDETYGPIPDACRQQWVSRRVVEEKKVELVSSLLRPDGGQEYKQKMEEFAAAVRHHRQSLVLEDLKHKKELHSKLIAGIMLWGVWLTYEVLSKLHSALINLDKKSNHSWDSH